MIATSTKYIRKIIARANARIEENAIKRARWSGMKNCASALATRKRKSARLASNGFLLFAGKIITRKINSRSSQ